jgi:hypothetical protein
MGGKDGLADQTGWDYGEREAQERAHLYLEEMHGFVGGYIELVRTLSGRVMFINEDGKRLELPVNRKDHPAGRDRKEGRGLAYHFFIGTRVALTWYFNFPSHSGLRGKHGSFCCVLRRASPLLGAGVVQPVPMPGELPDIPVKQPRNLRQALVGSNPHLRCSDAPVHGDAVNPGTLTCSMLCE